MDKKIILALSAILGSSAIASNSVKTDVTDLDESQPNTLSFKKSKTKQFALKVNFNNVEDSKACFHASHSSHSSHYSHSSHSSSSFV